LSKFVYFSFLLKVLNFFIELIFKLRETEEGSIVLLNVRHISFLHFLTVMEGLVERVARGELSSHALEGRNFALFVTFLHRVREIRRWGIAHSGSRRELNIGVVVSQEVL
jgi:hypothetical protein